MNLDEAMKRISQLEEALMLMKDKPRDLIKPLVIIEE